VVVVDAATVGAATFETVTVRPLNAEPSDVLAVATAFWRIAVVRALAAVCALADSAAETVATKVTTVVRRAAEEATEQPVLKPGVPVVV